MCLSEEISDLEKALYDKLAPGRHQIKVAMLVALTFDGKTISSDEIVNAALERLVRRADIESFGNIFNWRRSEIRRLS
ncbi:hypothetical protein [Roseibium sp. MMSF_3412]|uniref:hypothetical protein n=1 Tax=Roseibium sp. MMSF_3412 TaxID=3046712 RepID=UPI00273ED8B4|nr:hypothetical protein [Roseibium sp. MMSF_3412]